MKAIETQTRALAEFLSKEKIAYAIIGGVAVYIYGEPRLTSDVDVNIILDRHNIGKFLKNAKRYGFLPAISKTPELARAHGVMPMTFVRGNTRGAFDFIIAENVLELNAIKRSRTKRVGSINVKVVAPEDLIIHKITSQRARDVEDVSGILIRQKGKLDLKYIHKWLKTIDKTSPDIELNKKFTGVLKANR